MSPRKLKERLGILNTFESILRVASLAVEEGRVGSHGPRPVGFLFAARESRQTKRGAPEDMAQHCLYEIGILLRDALRESW